MNILLATIVILGVTGLAGALLLYATSRAFATPPADPREDAIREVLPGANCGACGLKGCSDFARECVARGNLDGLNCPGAGPEGMKRIAEILGVAKEATDTPVAVLHCSGSCSARPRPHLYDGARSCAVIASTGIGTSGCAWGCLGCGDCVSVCRFGALSMDPETGLPVIDPEKCTGCGVCAGECPRKLIELRPRGRRDRRVWVSCSSRDKGATARKVCTAACIGCGKCARACPFEAITISDNLAYINPEACKACGKCITVCPTGAIHATFSPVVKNETQEL